MADRIPELYQLAYSMYQDQGTDMRMNMDMLTALEQGDYNKYLNLLNQYNTDRNFAYGVYSDAGGADGSEYNPWGDSRWNSQTGNYDTSKWQSNTAATRPNRVESMEPFSYESAPE